MFRRILQFSLPALALLLFTIQISAQPDPLNGTIALHSRTQVADKSIAPGKYRVVFERNEERKSLCAFVSPVKNDYQAPGYSNPKFEREGIVVAEVPCTLNIQSKPANGDSAVLKQNRLTEVQFRGKTQAVDFAK